MPTRRTATIVVGSSDPVRWVIRLCACAALTLLSACAYNRKLETPVPLASAAPISSAADERLSVTLEAVIVRGGPGSWSKNADWDEYMLQARATSDQPVDITRVAVVDSLGKQLPLSASRDHLRRESKKTTRRYEDTDFKVTAGSGGGLAATGYAVGGASAAAGLATLGSSGAAAGAAVVGAVVVAPVLMTAGVVVRVQQIQVEKEIKRRSTPLPAKIPAGEETALDAFFPIAPSPRQLEVTYRDAAGGEHVLAVDTRSALNGLHLLAD